MTMAETTTVEAEEVETVITKVVATTVASPEGAIKEEVEATRPAAATEVLALIINEVVVRMVAATTTEITVEAMIWIVEEEEEEETEGLAAVAVATRTEAREEVAIIPVIVKAVTITATLTIAHVGVVTEAAAIVLLKIPMRYYLWLIQVRMQESKMFRSQKGE